MTLFCNMEPLFKLKKNEYNIFSNINPEEYNNIILTISSPVF